MNIGDVEKLADLARIELSESEKESLLSDMKGILDYVKIIENVEVDTEMPEYKTYNIWREDLPASGGGVPDENSPEASKFSLEIITKQFPDAQDGFLKVKKIL